MKGKRHKRTKKSVHLDSDLLAEIYDTYQRPVYAAIFRQVSDVETARDLTADVFHRLLQAVQKGQGPTRNVKAWLYRTAHNIVVDHYRRRQFRDHDPLLADPPSDTPDPSHTAANQIRYSAVRSALTALTLEQRQVINLRFLEGLPSAEVARIMNKSTGAVKALQHRALTALRSEIERQAGDRQSGSDTAVTPSTPKEKGMDSAEPIPVTYQPLLNTNSQ